jgi:hypothetical protein
VTLWSEQLTAEKATAMDGLLSTLPLTPTPLFLFGQGQDLWPIHQTSAVADSLFNSSSQAASLLWNIAMAHLENGRIAEAAAALKSTVEEDPETALRPLTRTYLRLTTGETIEAEPPSNLIPVTPDIFAPDSDQKNASDAERGNDFGTVRVAK